MFHANPVLRLEDSYHALLAHKYPVNVEYFADPWLYVLDLVAELRHVGEGQCVFCVTVRDAAYKLPDAEPEIKADSRGRSVHFDMPSVACVGMFAYVVDAGCLDTVETTILEVIVYDLLDETLIGICTRSFIL